jgi:cation-transporting ATPase 13A1
VGICSRVTWTKGSYLHIFWGRELFYFNISVSNKYSHFIIRQEFILTVLKQAGYVTLMCGDGTNDVGALKQAHIGVALLDGKPEDLKKIAEHHRMQRLKDMYENQLKFTARFNMPPPPPPAAIAHLFPHITQQLQQQNPAAPRRAPAQVDQIAEQLIQDFDDEPPTIKLGDASVAAPFTSKLSNVVASKDKIYFFTRYLV